MRCVSCVQNAFTRENYMIEFSSYRLDNLKNLQLAGRKGTALFFIFLTKYEIVMFYLIIRIFQALFVNYVKMSHW